MKRIHFKFLFLFFGFLFLSVSANASPLKDYKKIVRQEPGLNSVIAAWFKHAGLDLRQFSSWEKKVKVAPFLPTLYLGYDHALKESQGMSVTDNTSISGGVVTLGPEDNDYDYDSNLGQTIRVRAVWKLEETVFNQNMLSVAREKREMARLQFDLSQKIEKIYEQRSLALLKYLELRGAASSKAGAYYAKYIILTDQLDEMTGREFSKRWWREDKDL